MSTVIIEEDDKTVPPDSQKRCTATNRTGERCQHFVAKNLTHLCTWHAPRLENNVAKASAVVPCDSLAGRAAKLLAAPNIAEIMRRVDDWLSDRLDPIFIETPLEQIQLWLEREDLRRQIKQLAEFDEQSSQEYRKVCEIRRFSARLSLGDFEEYRALIYNPWESDHTAFTIDQLDPEIVIVPRYCDSAFVGKTPAYIAKQHRLWEFFRVFTSSIDTHQNRGRHIRAFLRDRATGHYFGIMAIGSDVLPTAPLSAAIGWDKSARRARLNYLVNLVCCVGLRPTSYNLNVGKLIAMAAFSRELQVEYHRRYGHYYACVDTFGINGKSIQYDRLKCFKYLPTHTKGSIIAFSIEIKESVNRFLKALGYDVESYNRSSYRAFVRQRDLFNELALNPRKHETAERGIYYGYTAPDAQAFLCQRNIAFHPILKPFSEIVVEWRERFARQRYQHLVATERVIYQRQLYQPYFDEITEKMLYAREYRTRQKEKVQIALQAAHLSNTKKPMIIIKKREE